MHQCTLKCVGYAEKKRNKNKTKRQNYSFLYHKHGMYAVTIQMEINYVTTGHIWSPFVVISQ